MRLALFTVLLGLALTGCDSPSRTVDTTRKQIAEFSTAPDPKKQDAIESSLAKLDEEIAALEKKGDRATADRFRRDALSLRTDFQAAKVAAALKTATQAIQGIGEAFKDAGKTFMQTIRETNSE